MGVDGSKYTTEIKYADRERVQRFSECIQKYRYVMVMGEPVAPLKRVRTSPRNFHDVYHIRAVHVLPCSK